MLQRRISVGSGADGRWNSFTRVELNQDDILVGNEVLSRFRPRFYTQLSPNRFINLIVLDAYFGDEIDFDNAREGKGLTLATTLTLRPGAHLEFRNDASGRWLNVDAANGQSAELFHAGVERLRATYSFSSRSFVRLIGQYELTVRDTSLYTFPVSPKEAKFGGSALFAYKLNWQTVLYAGYGDNREFLERTDKLEPSARQLFAKISYAWQN
jgi:hypothetical protein